MAENPAAQRLVIISPRQLVKVLITGQEKAAPAMPYPGVHKFKEAAIRKGAGFLPFNDIVQYKDRGLAVADHKFMFLETVKAQAQASQKVSRRVEVRPKFRPAPGRGDRQMRFSTADRAKDEKVIPQGESLYSRQCPGPDFAFGLEFQQSESLECEVPESCPHENLVINPTHPARANLPVFCAGIAAPAAGSRKAGVIYRGRWLALCRAGHAFIPLSALPCLPVAPGPS